MKEVEERFYVDMSPEEIEELGADKYRKLLNHVAVCNQTEPGQLVAVEKETMKLPLYKIKQRNITYPKIEDNYIATFNAGVCKNGIEIQMDITFDFMKKNLNNEVFLKRLEEMSSDCVKDILLSAWHAKYREVIKEGKKE